LVSGTWTSTIHPSALKINWGNYTVGRAPMKRLQNFCHINNTMQFFSNFFFFLKVKCPCLDNEMFSAVLLNTFSCTFWVNFVRIYHGHPVHKSNRVSH
jgi:hypothetical protein